MLQLLAEVYETFPEQGDSGRPELIIFIDEAHLVFDEASKALLNQIESIVKLIRSKGIGLYFVTQNPKDVPEDILAQLGLKDASETMMARREDGLFKPFNSTEDGFDFESGPQAASLSPGSLEGSNVSAVQTLVKFIDHMRSFEMQTKVIREMKDNDASGAAMMRLS